MVKDEGNLEETDIANKDELYKEEKTTCAQIVEVCIFIDYFDKLKKL